MVSPSCAAARRWGWWGTACPFQLLLLPSAPLQLVDEGGEASQAIFGSQSLNPGSTNKKLFNKRVCRFGTKFAIFLKSLWRVKTLDSGRRLPILGRLEISSIYSKP